MFFQRLGFTERIEQRDAEPLEMGDVPRRERHFARDCGGTDWKILEGDGVAPQTAAQSSCGPIRAPAPKPR
jgi:hypothetical protein